MPSRQKWIVTHCPEETLNLGEMIGKLIDCPLIFALTGDLGSGKTAFVQGLAKGLDVPSDYYITSPTFTLVNEYPGRCRLIHVDLYRLEGVDELEDIGLEDLMDDQAVTAIEWADKLSGNLPAGYLSMNFEISGDEDRKISLIAYGHNEVNLIKALEKYLKTGIK
jgi:tRNA threonylcarbamoyladenosine biosynthesis protein TsaE